MSEEKILNNEENIILEQITDEIYHLSFPTRREISSTLLRFQEYYENPEFKGKIFTLGEFAAWLLSQSELEKGTDLFTFYDWGGFNFPSETLKPFYEGKFDPLNEKEKNILHLLKGINEPFYIIGTFRDQNTEDDLSRLKHEIAHGLFYTNENYKIETRNVLKNISPELKTHMYNYFREKEYHKDVWEDEIHAYILTGLDDVEEEQKFLEERKKIRILLEDVFNRYYISKKK